MKTDVIFLNHQQESCGVYQYGKRLYNILALEGSNLFEYIYIEIGSASEYEKIYNDYGNGHIFIYNYHAATMPWLNKRLMRSGITHVGIPHESPAHYFDLVIDIPAIPRPLFVFQGPASQIQSNDQDVHMFINYNEGPDVPIFGSFGFGFDNKGFDRIVQLVNEQFNRAIIKFVIPRAHYDPKREQTVQQAREKCIQANKKSPAIKLMITHSFLSDQDILLFLSRNTINLFLYDKMHGRGISSALDYAMSVGVPIGISDSYMFRHVYRDDICVYKRSIIECIKNNFSKRVNPIENNKHLCQVIEQTLFHK